ncbi:MAG: leucine-rich repeat domain-containing protein [Paludibacteraceae bacterium]|nr:leucine-rich repeat domain-containing protein [Paludibacteraceae bacterium]
MRKLLALSTALTLCLGLWANQITYEATAALSINDNTFNIKPSSHAWSPDTQKGTITFDSDVTTITENAFKGSGLISMTLPGTITTIMGDVFSGCSNLTSITFEGVATSFAPDAFNGAGTAQAPVTLILPEEWNYEAAPTDNQTAWYGGFFNSNLYSKQESTEKQAALDAITEVMGDYSESTYMQSLVAEYVTNINNAPNRKTINENKQAAIAILQPIVAIYPTAFNEGDAAGYARGLEEGKAAGNAEVLGAMAEPCTNCTAVEVTDGTTTVTLYNATNVGYIKK